jgi:methyl-accepting chemotaxis protein
VSAVVQRPAPARRAAALPAAKPAPRKVVNAGADDSWEEF